MTDEQRIKELRHDIINRNQIEWENGRHLTDLELRMYQKLMKRVNKTDPFVKTNQD